MFIHTTVNKKRKLPVKCLRATFSCYNFTDCENMSDNVTAIGRLSNKTEKPQ